MSKYSAIPNVSFKNPETALQFLKDALGFSEYSVYRDDKDKIQYGELTLGKEIIMISPANNESEFGKHTPTPIEEDGYNI